jgi:hypothetical protein
VRPGRAAGWVAAAGLLLGLAGGPGSARAATADAPGMAASADAAAVDWQIELHSDRHSDALPLAAMGHDDWQRLKPRAGRNLAYVDDELRLSRRQGDWTWSLLARNHATLVASEDALALAALVDSGQHPAADRRWNTALQLRAFAGAGLALGHAHRFAPGWSAHGELQLLALGHWRERALQGPVQYTAADGRYAFDLQSTETNDRLDFPFQQPYARQGAALLLAGGLAWDGPAAWARVDWRDGGWLHWHGVPQQEATLNTATQAVDADGFLIYQPLVQGRNRQDGPTRWLPWRGTLAAGPQWPDGQRLGLRLDTLPGWGVLPALQWQRPSAVPGGLALAAEWRLHERRLDLMLAWRGLTLRAGADRLDGQARSHLFALGWSHRF